MKIIFFLLILAGIFCLFGLLEILFSQERNFKDKEGNAKTENNMQVRLQGAVSPVSMRVNWTSIGALIDAFGKDSKDWVGKVVTAKTMEQLVADTVRTIVYLIPEGFELAKTAEKKMVIRKVGEAEESVDVSDDEDSKEFIDSIPF